MASILKQLTIREFLGKKNPTDFTLSNTPVTIYTSNEINNLLGGASPEPEGVRFHFKTNTGNPTTALIAIGLGVVAVGAEFRNRELGSSYLRRESNLDPVVLTALPQDMKDKTSGQNACVFFSRADLLEILGQAGISGIAFYTTTVVRALFDGATSTSDNYTTLVAVGVDGNNAPQGIRIRSEMPCPPNCGDDYP